MSIRTGLLVAALSGAGAARAIEPPAAVTLCVSDQAAGPRIEPAIYGQFFDKVESQLRQSLRAAAEQAGLQMPTVDANGRASALTALAVGRPQCFTRSVFKRNPTEQIERAPGLLT